MSKSTFIASLCALSGVLANNAIPEHFFTDNNGDLAADAGSPMWHFASGSCLSSAAEDGQGHQTDGVDVPVVLCGINQKQDEGCPGDSSWQGFNTFYHGAAGEPWDVVPTYYASRKCGDGSWKTYYGMYFKKDVSHKSDWEYAILRWVPDASGNWVRDSVVLEVDGKEGGGAYSDITSTFDNSSDQFEDGNQGRDHPKFYFGKRHHSVHWDMESRNKGSCVGPEFRANDFQFWAASHLRHVDNVDAGWDYGTGTNPHKTVDEMCG